MKQQQKAQKAKKGLVTTTIVSTVLTAAMVAGVGAFVVLNFDTVKAIANGEKLFSQSQLDEQNGNTNGVLEEFGNNDGVIHQMTSKMNFSQAALTASEGQGISVIIKATVLPVTAKNKEVDWSVSWEDELSDLIVTDFLTVEPQSDGSAVATVTCKKAFTKNIEVVVTTRIGNFTAKCTVSFVGIPSTMVLTNNTLETIVDETYGTCFKVFINDETTHSFNISLLNGFDSVGADHSTYSYSISGMGTYYGQDYLYGGRGRFTEDGDIYNCDITSLFNYENSGVGVLIGNGKINIVFSQPRHTPEFMDTIGEASIKGFFSAWNSDNHYVDLKVTETKSGVFQTIRFQVDTPVPSVSSVSLSNTKLNF